MKRQIRYVIYRLKHHPDQGWAMKGDKVAMSFSPDVVTEYLRVHDAANFLVEKRSYGSVKGGAPLGVSRVERVYEGVQWMQEAGNV